MVFPECKSYVDGNAPLEAQFSLIREAILNKNGLTDDIDAFRAEMATFIQLETLLAEARPVPALKEPDFFKEGQQIVKASIASVKDLADPKPWTIPVTKLHTYSTYAQQYKEGDFEPYIKFPKEKLAALFALMG